LLEKGAWAYPGTVQCFEYPFIPQASVKVQTSNFVHTFISIASLQQKQLRYFGKSRLYIVGVLMDSRNFSGNP